MNSIQFLEVGAKSRHVLEFPCLQSCREKRRALHSGGRQFYPYPSSLGRHQDGQDGRMVAGTVPAPRDKPGGTMGTLFIPARGRRRDMDGWLIRLPCGEAIDCGTAGEKWPNV